MKKLMAIALMGFFFCSCQTGPGEVMDNIMVDFGLRPKPEGYVSGADKVFEKMNAVGATEMKRLNLAEQHGQVKFQKEGDFRGKYYKEVKVYEAFYPSDVKPISRSSNEDSGYNGFIEYAYRIYQSSRADSSADAAARTADIPTDEVGRDTYRYTFGSSGEWNGAKGEKTKR